MGDLAVVRKHLRILDWLLLGAFAGALLLFLADGIFYIASGWAERYETFGKTVLDRADPWVPRVLGCLWLAWIIQTLRRAARRGLGAWDVILVGFFSLLTLYIASLCWQMGLAFLNGLLDTGPKQPVEVVVRDWHSIKTRSARWGVSAEARATVSRVGHLDERVGIRWWGCDLPKGVDPSPHAAIMMGQGAFGAPWYGPRVTCRPLRVDEYPLFKSFHLARGKPIAIFSLSERGPADIEWEGKRTRQRNLLVQNLSDLAAGDTRVIEGHKMYWAFESGVDMVRLYTDFLDDGQKARLDQMLEEMHTATKSERQRIGQRAIGYVEEILDAQNEEKALAPWLKALQASSVDLEIALVRRGQYRGPGAVSACTGCKALVESDLDDRIVRILPQASGLWDGDTWRVWVADGNGQLVLRADLAERGRIGELATALAARAPKH